MNPVIKAGMIVGLAAGPATAGAELKAISGNSPDKAGMIVALDTEGRPGIMVLDATKRTELYRLADHGGNSALDVPGDPDSKNGSERRSDGRAMIRDEDCIAALHAMTEARLSGEVGSEFTKEEEAVLEAHCMMTNTGECSLNVYAGCGAQ